MMHHIETRAEEQTDRLRGVHARVKLLVGIGLLILLLIARNTLFPLTVGLVCLFAFVWTGISIREYLHKFGEPVFITAVLVFLKAFGPGNHVLLSLEITGLDLAVTLEGLTEGLQVAARILGAVSVLVLISTTTPLVSLLSALSWLKVPKTFVEILFFAYRYTFVLFDDAKVVYASQRNRLGYTGTFRRLKSFGTLASAVLLRALEQSTNTTTAMVQRGYTGQMHLSDETQVPREEVVLALVVLTLFSGYLLALENVMR